MSKIWDTRKVDFLKQVDIYYSADVFLPIDNKNNIPISLQKGKHPRHIEKYDKVHTVKRGYSNSSGPTIFVTLVCYNQFNMCSKMTIWDCIICSL